MLRPRFLVGRGLALAMLAAPASAQQPAPTYDVAPGIAALLAAVRAPQGVTRPQAAAIALALLAHGSTLRSGPHRDQLKALMPKLRDGSERKPAAPLHESVLVTLALASVAASSQSTLVARDVVEHVEALCARLTDGKEEPPSAKDQVLLRLLF